MALAPNAVVVQGQHRLLLNELGWGARLACLLLVGAVLLELRDQARPELEVLLPRLVDLVALRRRTSTSDPRRGQLQTAALVLSAGCVVVSLVSALSGLPLVYVTVGIVLLDVTVTAVLIARLIQQSQVEASARERAATSEEPRETAGS